MTRRQFIGTAAAATAFTIVPRHVIGQTTPSNLVNIAVVGSGGHGAFSVTQMLSDCLKNQLIFIKLGFHF